MSPDGEGAGEEIVAQQPGGGVSCLWLFVSLQVMIDLIDHPFDRPVLLLQDGNALLQRGQIQIQIFKILDVRTFHATPFQFSDGSDGLIV